MVDVKNLLAGVLGEDNVSYRHFPAPPSLPYAVYYETSSQNFGADNRVYFRRQNVVIELYEEFRNPTTEQAVESALNGAGVFWDKDETYIDNERMYLISYNIEV